MTRAWRVSFDAAFRLDRRARLNLFDLQRRTDACFCEWFARFLRDLIRHGNVDRMRERALLKHSEIAGSETRPDFVICERRGGDHCDTIRGSLGEIDRHCPRRSDAPSKTANCEPDSTNASGSECENSACPFDIRKLNTPYCVMLPVNSANASNSSSSDGCEHGNALRRPFSNAQKVSSLSVVPTG